MASWLFRSARFWTSLLWSQQSIAPTVTLPLMTLAVVIGVFTPESSAASEPYLPDSDDEVLLVLPTMLLAERNELNKLRGQLTVNPSNPELAAMVAARYVSIGNREGDPRYYGYARAAIHRWWKADDAPPSILMIRAKLKEKEHLYGPALEDLEKVIRRRPRDVQALIEIANLHRVQGRYADALEIGDSLETFAGQVPTALCRAPVLAATGHADQAYQLLTDILPAAEEQFPSTVEWILTVRAEIAAALGRDTEVEQHYQDGLSRDPANFQLLRGYADFLLDRSRDQEALSLLNEHTRDNGVLLAAAIAAHKTGDAALLRGYQDQLETRFQEIRLRGGQPHGRFESRYVLEIKEDPPLALGIALANWKRQKEVRDTRNVLEAAMAAGNPEAARPVIDFLRESGTRHVVLDRLVTQLEEE